MKDYDAVLKPSKDRSSLTTLTTAFAFVCRLFFISKLSSYFLLVTLLTSSSATASKSTQLLVLSISLYFTCSIAFYCYSVYVTHFFDSTIYF